MNELFALTILVLLAVGVTSVIVNIFLATDILCDFKLSNKLKKILTEEENQTK